MAKKKKKVTKKSSKKKKRRSKSNILKIQVEAKVPRKSSSKKKSKKRKPTKRKSHVNTEKVRIEMQPILVDNFVALQKVMVNLATKIDNQNAQLTKLLDLFELSAKSLAKKGFKLESGPEESKEVLNKLGELSEQNKIIAKGLTMIHEAPTPAPLEIPTAPAPLPTPKPIPKISVPGIPKAEEGYKKSAPAKKPVKK